jgi:uncharacterized protein (DUF2236 family)
MHTVALSEGGTMPAARSSAATSATASAVPPAQEWPAPLSAGEWDRRFPGILDAVTGMAGPANVILQLARPGVGYGVMESRVESGNLFKHPLKRTRTTFTYLAVALLGNTEEKLAYRQAVNRSHAQVHSTAQSPVRYNAFDPELQLWVAACLYWGLVDSYQRLFGPLTAAQEAELYRLAEPLGTTLQVRPGMWPADPAAFRVYWEEKIAQVHIDDAVRAFLMRLVNVEFLPPPLRLLLAPLHRLVAAGFLPPRLRAEMHLAWGPREQRRFDRLLAVNAFVSRRLPRPLRQASIRLVMWDFRRRRRKGLPLV